MEDMHQAKFIQVCDGVKSILGDTFTLINAQMGTKRGRFELLIPGDKLVVSIGEGFDSFDVTHNNRKESGDIIDGDIKNLIDAIASTARNMVNFKVIARDMKAEAIYSYPVCTDEAKLTFYHASTVDVPEPIWTYAQDTTGLPQLRDFGLGFYTCSADISYPLKLASANDELILNKYETILKGLKYVELGLDLEWLLVVAFHRNDFESKKWCHTLRDRCRTWLAGFDVVVGVISNDKTYSALEGFIDGDMTDEAALAMLNASNYGMQHVFKSSEGCARLRQGFVGAQVYSEEERLQFLNSFIQEKKQFDTLAEELKIKHRRDGFFIDEIIKGELFDGRVRF